MSGHKQAGPPGHLAVDGAPPSEAGDWRERHEAALRASGLVLYEWDTAADLSTHGGDVEGVLGHSAEELGGGQGGGLERWAGHVHPEDRAAFLAEARRAAQSGQPFHMEYRFRKKDGSYAVVRDDGGFVPARDGRGARLVGFVADVTRQKRLEEQFLQAQKMEAVGQLAGGVAHDFNNLLTVINGYGELLLSRLPQGDPNRELVKEMALAGARAAGLTRQLLAFSRRAVVEPRVLSLADVVAEMGRLLRRVIGEDVELVTRFEPGAGAVRADPGQLSQVLLNLAVNARDAMPQGGRLTVEVRGVELGEEHARSRPGARAGPHVLLSVSDTGSGIAPEALPHLFEPFFTTKGPGKGTGLGLAVVHGVVSQAGGHVTVSSEPGRGTTFLAYFPRAGGAGPPAPAPGPAVLPRGTEAVLLVEDDAAVRALAGHVLRSCGYDVLEAADGQEALRVAGGHPGRIDLLLTDVVMPRSGGREAAERITALRPGLKVLFCSGHAGDAVLRHGVMEQDAALLQKPYSPAALAQKVREVLGG